MKVLIQANPISKLNFASDTTLYIANELQNRGATLNFFLPSHIRYQSGKIIYNEGFQVNIKYHAQSKKKYACQPALNLDASTMDLVLVRQDPPFDDFYYYTCKLLSVIEHKTLILNSPTGIANLPEKISPMFFPNYAPKTLLSFSHYDYQHFFTEHKRVIIKPLSSYAGNDIMLLKSQKEYDQYFYKYLMKHKYVIMQEYLSKVATAGDKRIILLNGKVLTQYTKLPEKGSIVTNLAAGGTAVACELTKREKEISNAVGELMKKNGIFLAGLDVADEKLLEVNITSPTGLVAASKLYNKDYAKIVVDEIEKMLR